MRINYFTYDKKTKGVNHKKKVTVGNPCPCGCSPNPYLILSDGKTHHMNLIFESDKEINAFIKRLGELKC